MHRAARRIAGVAHRTPVLTSGQLDDRTGAALFLKAEHLQRVGAFKFRGATNAVAALDTATRARGVVAFSSGNHAQAVALTCRIQQVPATIVMPQDAPPVKLDATRGYGAEVVTYDRFTEDRRAIGQRIAEERGATVIPPFDHPDIVAGQGTAALELLEAVPDLDLLVAPIGGGGLLAGCTAAARGLVPDLEVVGVEPAGRHAARDALARGEVVEVPVPRTVLDGQQTAYIGAIPLAVLSHHGVRVVGVEDAAALDTVAWVATRMKQVVEPSGAAALAALLDGTIDVRGRRVGVVLSGGNVAPALLADALRTSGAEGSTAQADRPRRG
ncbi:pyridoxal-phosphate dependent enzyme [Nitriliruptor alkaliphilus]|uniref:pyridoxal-phosphate dependent enzyme n=1 Tax=Nitriliruptor alkaliphilus TaxID=427918 RepID=UPI000AE7CEE8|nr:pyridoxal-phosphate dependent enzyme [Nitriliruptor alkaliphilus]